MRSWYYFSATAGSRSITSTGSPDNIGLASYTGMDASSIVATTTQSNQGPFGGNYVRSVTQTLPGGWQISVGFTDFGRFTSANSNFVSRALCENSSILDTNGTISSGSYTGSYISGAGGSREYAVAVTEVKPAAASSAINSGFFTASR